MLRMGDGEECILLEIHEKAFFQVTISHCEFALEATVEVGTLGSEIQQSLFKRCKAAREEYLLRGSEEQPP